MQPATPQLPPMQPMTPVSSPGPASAAAAPKATIGGTRRLRQVVGYIGGASLGFVMLVMAGELALKPGLRPSDGMATIEARTELGIMNQRMGRNPGEHVLNEAQYQEILARAQRQGAAKAELDFQRQLATVQADKERVVGAYSTLYQRTNEIARAGLQVETQAQAFRQRLIEQTNGGRAMVLTVLDGLCAIGDQSSCDKAAKLRSDMVSESTTLTGSDLARKINELMAGVDDPAAFVTHDDQRRNGPPALPR